MRRRRAAFVWSRRGPGRRARLRGGLRLSGALASGVVDGALAGEEELRDGHEGVSLLDELLENGGQGLGGVEGRVVEEHNGTRLDLACHPLDDLSGGQVLPVQAIPTGSGFKDGLVPEDKTAGLCKIRVETLGSTLSPLLFFLLLRFCECGIELIHIQPDTLKSQPVFILSVREALPAHISFNQAVCGSGTLQINLIRKCSYIVFQCCIKCFAVCPVVWTCFAKIRCKLTYNLLQTNLTFLLPAPVETLHNLQTPSDKTGFQPLNVRKREGRSTPIIWYM